MTTTKDTDDVSWLTKLDDITLPLWRVPAEHRTEQVCIKALDNQLGQVGTVDNHFIEHAICKTLMCVPDEHQDVFMKHLRQHEACTNFADS